MNAIRSTAVLWFLLLAGVYAGDWPQWRGTNRDAVFEETELLEHFPTEGLKIRWRAEVGPGFSSPIIAAGGVYVTDAKLAAPKAEQRVQCFDEITGKLRWSHAYEVTYPSWAFDEKSKQGPVATPLVHGGKLYTVDWLGHVLCYDAKTGAVLWRKDRARAEPGTEPMWGASPLVENGLLILFAGKKPSPAVIALNKDTGDEVWKAVEESASNGSPLVIQSGGVRQLIVWTQESVTSLDPATGRTFWRERVMANPSSPPVATPVFADGRLLISGLMLQLDPEKPAAKVLWPESSTQRILSDTSTPLLQAGCVFAAKNPGHLICLDATTGRQLWQTDQVTELRSGSCIHLTANGATTLLFTDQGNLIRARLTPTGYEEISRAHVLDGTVSFSGRKVLWSPPSFAHGHLFARNDREVVCISFKQ